MTQQSKAQKAWKKKHYREHKDTYLAKQSKRRDEIKAYIIRIKLDSGCIRCGYVKCEYALEFHHTNPTEKGDSLATAIRDKWSKARIDKEMIKCILLCANCHREAHY